MRAVAFLIPLILVTTDAGEGQQSVRIQQWSVQGTAPVSVTVPVERAPQTVMARAADGSWRQLEAQGRDGTVDISLGTEQMSGGSALIVIDPPQWLSLEDAGPPAVELFAVDGEDRTDRQEVSLGWAGDLPESIVLQVRDDANPIDRGSLMAQTPVGLLKPRDRGVTFIPDGPMAGTLTVHPREIEHLDRTTHARIVLVVDDYAIDDEQTVRSVSWSLSPSMTLDDSTILTVDSVTSESRWRDWTVVADGEVMTESDTTTAGVTWMSDDRPDEHWIRWRFPGPREVTGVKLDWARWEVWRTSRNYDVQVLRDEEWVTLVEVRDQDEQATSEHRFDPVTTEGVRVLQMPMGGHSGRQDLMWLANAEVISAD